MRETIIKDKQAYKDIEEYRHAKKILVEKLKKFDKTKLLKLRKYIDYKKGL